MLITVKESKLLKELFSGWVSMEDAIDWEDEDRKAQVRCAITAYSHHVQDLLAEIYGVEQEEHEYFDLDESDPSKWEIEKTVVHPKKGGE